jgi:anti-sigma factor RsiW
MNHRAGGCPQLEDISALMDGELTHLAARELKLHAATCAVCGATLQQFSQLHGQLQPLRDRKADVDIASLVMPRLAAAPTARPTLRPRSTSSPWPSLWSFGPRALGGAAALGAGVYLGLMLLAGGGTVLRPAGMTAFDAEPVGSLCAGLPSCSARGR